MDPVGVDTESQSGGWVPESLRMELAHRRGGV